MIKINTKVFSDTLKRTLPAHAQKSTLHILKTSRITINYDELEITTTDLNLSVSAYSKIDGGDCITFCADTKKLLDILNGLGDVDLDLKLEDYLLTLSYDKYKVNLTVFDSMEFPDSPSVEKYEHNLTLEDVKSFGVVAEFASTDLTRLSLNGVLFKDGYMVATDGHRLAKKKSSEFEGELIVPVNLKRCLINAENDFQFSFDDNYIYLVGDGIKITSKLIEGPYPKYENVIPDTFERTATIEKEWFSQVIKRVSAIANARTKQIKIHLEGNSAEVSTRNPDIGGDTKDSLYVLNYEGDAFDVGFNSQYLLQILNYIESENAILKGNSAVGAFVLEDSEDLFLLMPLRLPEE